MGNCYAKQPKKNRVEPESDESEEREESEIIEKTASFEKTSPRQMMNTKKDLTDKPEKSSELIHNATIFKNRNSLPNITVEKEQTDKEDRSYRSLTKIHPIRTFVNQEPAVSDRGVTFAVGIKEVCSEKMPASIAEQSDNIIEEETHVPVQVAYTDKANALLAELYGDVVLLEKRRTAFKEDMESYNAALR